MAYCARARALHVPAFRSCYKILRNFLHRHLRRHYGISAVRAMQSALMVRGIYRVRLKVYDRMQPDRERVCMTKSAKASALASVLAAVLVLVVAVLLVTAARAQSVA